MRENKMMTPTRSRSARHKFAAGFTLTEIIVAAALVGILAAIAVLQYQSHTLRARIAGTLEFASESRTRVALDLAQGKNVQTDLLNNGGNPVNDITGLVWYPAAGGAPITGHILATMKLPGQGLKNVFALQLNQGAVWQCVNAARYGDPAAALDNDYLPAACRDGAVPMATQPNVPAGPQVDIASACIGGDPGAFKTKSSGQGKPQFCAPEKSAAGAATGSSGSTSGSSSTSAGASSSSSDSNSVNNAGGAGGNDGTGGSAAAAAAAAVASDKVAEGAAANVDARGNATGSANKGDGARSQGPGSGFSTQGGSTTMCGANFEAINNACTLNGSPSPRLCRSSKENCETTHAPGRDCPAAQPFAANVVENLSDGSHYITRRCVSLSEAFQGVKKNRETQACTHYDADKVSYARFTCMFPCYGIDCNRNIVPGESATRLTWDNDVVEAGSGRKRSKTDSDLPDIFDNWACPRGTIADKAMLGRCVRDASAAAVTDGKAAAGAKSVK
jgi:prepilin-type N-terminal cleavage/methylation domain-containing protein